MTHCMGLMAAFGRGMALVILLQGYWRQVIKVRVLVLYSKKKAKVSTGIVESLLGGTRVGLQSEGKYSKGVGCTLKLPRWS